MKPQMKQNIKNIGITLINGLSITLHVQHLVTSNAQALYDLKILYAHSLCNTAIQAVYHSVVLARFLYASPAWWGFAVVQHYQKGFLHCSTHPGWFMFPRFT